MRLQEVKREEEDNEEKRGNNVKESNWKPLRIEDEMFESVSKRAWTDLLLQLYKVDCRNLLILIQRRIFYICGRPGPMNWQPNMLWKVCD